MPLTRPISRVLIGIRKRRKHFIRKRVYARLFEGRGYGPIAAQLLDCQETEVLACCSSCGKSWYILNRCRLRVCPLCSFQVAKLRGEFLKAMTKDMHHPKLLTLTMPLWTGDPHDGIKHLRQSFAKLRRNVLFKNVRGGAYQIELKEKDSGWHIHLHVLLDAPFIPYQQLFSAWRLILGIEAPQIHITAATSSKAREYACKYAAKSADFDAHAGAIVNWYLATKGERLFATFGEWYNATIEDLDQDQKPRDELPGCPYCGQHKSTFLARDGPWIYGMEDWRTLQDAITQGQDYSRTLLGADKEITDPERPEEKEERQCHSQQP